jgi:hypothetical protein
MDSGPRQPSAGAYRKGDDGSLVAEVVTSAAVLVASGAGASARVLLAFRPEAVEARAAERDRLGRRGALSVYVSGHVEPVVEIRKLQSDRSEDARLPHETRAGSACRPGGADLPEVTAPRRESSMTRRRWVLMTSGLFASVVVPAPPRDSSLSKPPAAAPVDATASSRSSRQRGRMEEQDRSRAKEGEVIWYSRAQATEAS